MRKVTIRDLHTKTEKYVRRAKQEAFLITDNGEVVAILKAVVPIQDLGVPFPKNHWKNKNLPSSRGNSTKYTADDRAR